MAQIFFCGESMTVEPFHPDDKPNISGHCVIFSRLSGLESTVRPRVSKMFRMEVNSNGAIFLGGVCSAAMFDIRDPNNFMLTFERKRGGDR